MLIGPPSGVVVTGASAIRGATALPVAVVSGSVKVENIDLHHVGQTAVVTIQTTIACGASGSSAWTVVGHNTDAYGNPYAKLLQQDPSSVLSASVSPCSLAFVAGRQPSAAATGATITSAPGDPGGPTIQVQLRNGNGAPASEAGVGITLTIKAGTGSAGGGFGGQPATPRTRTAGLISPRRSTSRVTATSWSPAPAGCSVRPPRRRSTSTTSPRSARGACSATAWPRRHHRDRQRDLERWRPVTLARGRRVDCNNAANRYYEGTSKALTFNVTGGTGRTTITLKLDERVGHQAVPEVRRLLQLTELQLQEQVRQGDRGRARPVCCLGASTAPGRAAIRACRQVVRPATATCSCGSASRSATRAARSSRGASAHRRPWRAEGPVQICPSCGEENPARFRLCGFCGTPLRRRRRRAQESPEDGDDRLLAT